MNLKDYKGPMESFESLVSESGEQIFVPNLTIRNGKLMKLNVAKGGIRFPVNLNIDVNLKYLDIINPALVS